MQPLTLALHGLRDTVAFGPCARKFAFVRNLQQREPIDSRVIFRRGTRTCCPHRLQVEDPARRDLHWLGIHEPIASYPYFVVCLGKLRQDVAREFGVPSGRSSSSLKRERSRLTRYRAHCPNNILVFAWLYPSR